MPERKELSAKEYQDQKPCAECGGRPGRNPASGVELKDGHTVGCSEAAAPAYKGRQPG